MRKTGTLTASLLLLAAPLALYAGSATASATSAPICFGKRATITGSGTIIGTPRADVIVGSADADTIDGRGGNDRICALAGNDTVQGGPGNDFINGGGDNDELTGDVRTTTGPATGGGRDAVFGGPGNDFIVGDSRADGVGHKATGAGRDLLDGGSDSDVVVGDSMSAQGDASGAGDDVILGGAGPDAVIGDSLCSADLCVVTGNGGDDFIDMGQASDPAPFENDFVVGDNRYLDNGPGLAGRAVGDGNDVIIGGPLADFLFGDNVGFDNHANPASGSGAGNDILRGHGNDDTLAGQGGNDRLDGGTETDDCDGGDGTDTAQNCETTSAIP